MIDTYLVTAIYIILIGLFAAFLAFYVRPKIQDSTNTSTEEAK